MKGLYRCKDSDQFKRSFNFVTGDVCDIKGGTVTLFGNFIKKLGVFASIELFPET